MDFRFFFLITLLCSFHFIAPSQADKNDEFNNRIDLSSPEFQPIFDLEEQSAIWKKAVIEKDTAAMNRLAQSFLKAAVQEVYAQKSLPHDFASDVINESYLVIRTAILNFKPELGFKLSSHVINCIKLRIPNLVDKIRANNLVRLNIDQRSKLRKALKIKEELELQGEEPTPARIAQWLGNETSVEQIENLLKHGKKKILLFSQLSESGNSEEGLFEESLGSEDNLRIETDDEGNPVLLDKEGASLQQAALRSIVSSVKFSRKGRLHVHNPKLRTILLNRTLTTSAAPTQGLAKKLKISHQGVSFLENEFLKKIIPAEETIFTDPELQNLFDLIAQHGRIKVGTQSLELTSLERDLLYHRRTFQKESTREKIANAHQLSPSLMGIYISRLERKLETFLDLAPQAKNIDISFNPVPQPSRSADVTSDPLLENQFSNYINEWIKTSSIAGVKLEEPELVILHMAFLQHPAPSLSQIGATAGVTERSVWNIKVRILELIALDLITNGFPITFAMNIYNHLRFEALARSPGMRPILTEAAKTGFIGKDKLSEPENLILNRYLAPQKYFSTIKELKEELEVSDHKVSIWTHSLLSLLQMVALYKKDQKVSSEYITDPLQMAIVGQNIAFQILSENEPWDKMFTRGELNIFWECFFSSTPKSAIDYIRDHPMSNYRYEKTEASLRRKLHYLARNSGLILPLDKPLELFFQFSARLLDPHYRAALHEAQELSFLNGKELDMYEEPILKERFLNPYPKSQRELSEELNLSQRDASAVEHRIEVALRIISRTKALGVNIQSDSSINLAKKLLELVGRTKAINGRKLSEEEQTILKEKILAGKPKTYSDLAKDFGTSITTVERKVTQFLFEIKTYLRSYGIPESFLKNLGSTVQRTSDKHLQMKEQILRQILEKNSVLGQKLSALQRAIIEKRWLNDSPESQANIGLSMKPRMASNQVLIAERELQFKVSIILAAVGEVAINESSSDKTEFSPEEKLRILAKEIKEKNRVGDYELRDHLPQIIKQILLNSKPEGQNDLARRLKMTNSTMSFQCRQLRFKLIQFFMLNGIPTAVFENAFPDLRIVEKGLSPSLARRAQKAIDEKSLNGYEMDETDLILMKEVILNQKPQKDFCDKLNLGLSQISVRTRRLKAKLAEWIDASDPCETKAALARTGT